MARQALRWEHPHLAGLTFEDLEREGTVRLSVPDPYRAVRGGRVPDAVREVRALLRALAQAGARSRARLRPAAGEPDAATPSARAGIRWPSSRRPRITS